jgi:XTP/dITP diphosphohydrolase
LADDSGLCVRALRGAPGVYSARYAQLRNGGEKSDAANNARLVEAIFANAYRPPRVLLLRPRAGASRRRSRAADCRGPLARDEIIDVPRGANGFGYDPHFFLPALARKRPPNSIRR